jgi:hypothetical protein
MVGRVHVKQFLKRIITEGAQEDTKRKEGKKYGLVLRT